MPKPLPEGLVFRQARPEDIPSLAQLLVSAPDDGTLYQFPHVMEYAEEMYDLHVGWLRPAIHEPASLIRVAVIPSPGRWQRVVGFSSWTKREVDSQTPGKSRPAKLAQTTWMDGTFVTPRILEFAR